MDKIKELAQQFCEGQYDFETSNEIWHLVLKYIDQNYSCLTLNHESIYHLWLVNGGHLRRKLADDQLLLSVLVKLLPKYTGGGMTLYRGECKFLYDAGKIGFCWTPKKSVAEMFARGLNSIESGGVLLKAYAPASAIIASFDIERDSARSVQVQDECEHTCNPNLLENIEVIDTFPRH